MDFSILKKTNRFHVLVAICWQVSLFFGAQLLFPIFSNYVPRWRCAFNDTTGCTAFARDCYEFETCIEPKKIFYEHVYFYSAALEFNLICGFNAYIATLFAQLQFVGVLIGTLLFGTMSDWLGRKPVSVFVLGFGIFVLALSAYAFNWQTYMAARFVVGLCNGGTVVVVYTYAMELLLPDHRIPLRAFFNWGIARFLLTVLCYIYPDWRTASLACAVFTVPALILVIFVMPESPAWLHSKNKLEQMRSNEMQIARFGGVKYQEVYHEPVSRTESFRELLHDKAVFKRLLVLWVMWFVASSSSYVTDLNSSNILGNLFLNQTLFSVLLIIAKPLLVPFDALNFSRRNLHQYAQLTVVICFCTLICLVFFNEHGALILVVNLLGVVFIEYTWDACYLCAVECMPTKLRASAVGSCSLVAGIGAVLAPTLAFMNTVWAPSAYCFVASLGSASLLVSFKWLVETKGVNLDKVKMHEEEPHRENIELVSGKVEHLQK